MINRTKFTIAAAIIATVGAGLGAATPANAAPANAAPAPQHSTSQSPDPRTGQRLSPHRVGKSRLGQVFRPTSEMIKISGCRLWLAHDKFISVDADRRITSIAAIEENYQTAKGVGPGSTLRAVRAAYPNAVLRTGRVDGGRFYYLTSRAGQDRLHLLFEMRNPRARTDMALVARGETPAHWLTRVNTCFD